MYIPSNPGLKLDIQREHQLMYSPEEMYAVKRRSIAFDLTKGCVIWWHFLISAFIHAVQYCLHLHSLHSPTTFTKVLHQKFGTHDKAVSSTTALTACRHYRPIWYIIVKHSNTCTVREFQPQLHFSTSMPRRKPQRMVKINYSGEKQQTLAN